MVTACTGVGICRGVRGVFFAEFIGALFFDVFAIEVFAAAFLTAVFFWAGAAFFAPVSFTALLMGVLFFAVFADGDFPVTLLMEDVAFTAGLFAMAAFTRAIAAIAS